MMFKDEQKSELERLSQWRHGWRNFRRQGTRKAFQLAEIQTGDIVIKYLVR